MKRIYCIILIISGITFATNAQSQVKIKMRDEGGVYTVPCTVNRLKLKFIFDTGASDVCISLSEALFMLKNGYLSDGDIVGSSKSRVADGSIVANTEIILREIEIGGKIIRNVKASVVHSLDAPLLLGQSAIRKLGGFRIDGNDLIIGEVDNFNNKKNENNTTTYGNETEAKKNKIPIFRYEVETYNSIYWHAEKSIALYKNKDFNEIIGYLKKDEEFRMVENELSFYSMIEIRITKIDKHDFEDCPDFFRVGDVIKKLADVEEAYYEVLHDGQIKLAAFVLYTNNSQKVYSSLLASCNPIEGDIIQNKEHCVLIAKIKTTNGKIGWIRLVCDDFKNINEMKFIDTWWNYINND